METDEQRQQRVAEVMAAVITQLTTVQVVGMPYYVNRRMVEAPNLKETNEGL